MEEIARKGLGSLLASLEREGESGGLVSEPFCFNPSPSANLFAILRSDRNLGQRDGVQWAFECMNSRIRTACRISGSEYPLG